MKKIINGKMYNTDTATLLAIYADNETNNIEERLYLKRTGEFFLYRWTIWSGYTIYPQDTYEAKQWIEEKGSTELYIELFGEPEE